MSQPEEEAMKCRQAAQLYRALKQENARLRQELAEKNRIDLRMNAEDAEVLAIVNGHNHPKSRYSVVTKPTKPIFDFDVAEIEGIDGEIVEILEYEHFFNNPKFRYYVRFALFLVIECVVWIAHHLGWVNLLTALTIAIFVFLLSNLRLI